MGLIRSQNSAIRRSAHTVFDIPPCFAQKASGLRWLSCMLLVGVKLAGCAWGLPFLKVLCPSERYHAESLVAQSNYRIDPRSAQGWYKTRDHSHQGQQA